VTNLENESEETLQNVLEYFSDLVTAIDPNPNSEDPEIHPCRVGYNQVIDFEKDLSQLLHKVQRHTKCGPQSTCWKKGKCRFNFPKPLQETASLTKSLEKSEWEFFPACNDDKLNKYNQFIIQLWRGNMDIAPVISKKALIAYLTKYIAKCEVSSKALDEIFTDIINKLQDDDKAKKVMQKVFIKSCAERDISAQEVMHTLLGLKLYNAGGRKFVTINFKNEEWIPVMDDTDYENGKKGTNIIEKYQSRGIEHANITLYHACLNYSLPKWTKPSKQNILRVFPRYKIENGENFFRQQVLLHVPWMDETQLLDGYDTWEELYIHHNIEEKVNVIMCELNGVDQPHDSQDSDNSDAESEMNYDNIEDEEAMILSRLGPQSTIPQVELGRREEDVKYDWHANDKEYKQFGTLKEMQTFLERMKSAEPTINTSASPMKIPDVTLNAEQQEIISVIKEQIATIKLNITDNSLPKSMIVQGKAGENVFK